MPAGIDWKRLAPNVCGICGEPWTESCAEHRLDFAVVTEDPGLPTDRQIAAMPDLLSALHNAVLAITLELSPDHEAALEGIRALAKAEGRS